MTFFFSLQKVGWVKFGFVEEQALDLCWRWRLQGAITEKNGTSWTLLNLDWLYLWPIDAMQWLIIRRAMERKGL